ncbi:MAG: ROK family protein [Acidimicrobiales bacterium]
MADRERHVAVRPAGIRAANAELVLQSLADGRAATRSELAERTSLTPQALGPILGDLVNAAQVIEAPSERPGPGRRPSEYRLDPLGSLHVEVVIRFAGHHVVVRDALGGLLQFRRQRHVAGPGPARLVRSLATTVRTMVTDQGAEVGAATTLAITIEGIVDESRQLVLQTPAWRATDVALAPLFAKHLGPEIQVSTTSAERALAARALDVIQPPASDLVAIIQISNQSRLMLAVDGEVIDNRLGSSGRLAHLPVEGNDRPCECGRTGCLGTVSSGAAVVRVYRELTDIQLDAGVDVIDRVHRGDPDAIEAARRSTEWLSRALGPLLRMVQPDRLIVTGAVGREGSRGAAALVETLRSHLDDDLRCVPIHVVQPEFGTIDESLASVLLG